MNRITGDLITGDALLDPTTSVGEIVPFPYSSNVGLVNGEITPRLSVLSQMSMDAAAVAWQSHPDSKVVLVGETCYGSDIPNTTDLMLERGIAQGIAKEAFVPLDALADGRPLNNTWLQTQALAEYVDAIQVTTGPTVVLSLEYHLQRVAFSVHAARQQILNPRFSTVESIFASEGNDDYNRYLPVIDSLRPSEKLLNLFNIADRRGKLLNFIAKGKGARVVDVVEENGQIKIENTLASAKLQALS